MELVEIAWIKISKYDAISKISNISKVFPANETDGNRGEVVFDSSYSPIEHIRPYSLRTMRKKLI